MIHVLKSVNVVQPEVIVGLGDNTTYNIDKPVKGQKRTIINLHIHLEDWLGDDLMECYPCCIVTEKLKGGLEKTAFSGFEFDELELTTDNYFINNYCLKKPLESFYWLKIRGIKQQHDFFIDENAQLNLSQQAFVFIKNEFSTNYLKVNPERDAFDDLLDEFVK